MLAPSRRSVLLGGGAALGVAALSITGVQVLLDSRAEMGRWLREILTRHLPDTPIPQDTFAAFLSDLLAETDRYSFRHEVMAVAESFLPTVPLPTESMRAKLEEFERWVITSFLVRTDYFDLVDPKVQPIQYLGMNVICSSPFASFES